MKLFTNLGLRSKLIGGFLLAAVVCSAAGVVGWWALQSVYTDAGEIGNNNLPSVRNLLVMKLGVEQIKIARRTLMNPNVSLNEIKLQLDNVAKAREASKKASETYAALPQSGEEATTWKAFVPAWEAVETSNTDYFGVANEFQKILEECVNADRPNPANYLNTITQATNTARDVEVILKKQVLAWKNLLLRGDDSKDFATYSSEMEETHTKILERIDALRGELAKLGIDTRSLNEAARSYAEFDAKSRALIEEHKKAGGEHIVALDKQGRSIAQTAMKAFEAVPLVLAERAVRAQRVGEKYSSFTPILIPREAKARELLDKLISINEEAAEQATKRCAAAFTRGTTFTLIATVAGLLLAVGCGMFLSMSIIKAVQKGVTFAQRMANGDLTQTLDIQSGDEIGQLGRALNDMTVHLREMFGQISKNTDVLSGSSNELSATATQLASGAEETTNQSATVAAAAEQMSANMTGMSASTEEVSANMKTVAAAVEELTASISEVSRNAQQAASVAGRASELAVDGNNRIGELGKAADEIGKVIDVIKDIADQTNLLALNATIEAARAGEAGKGFAVVATEVKELARQTTTATEDIRRRIEGIQTSSGEAVRSIGEITQAIAQVNEVSQSIAHAVDEQSTTTREIASNVAQCSTAAQTVAKGVAETATATGEIARNIAGVDQAAKQTAQGASSAHSASSQLSAVTEQLHSIVAQFKTSA